MIKWPRLRTKLSSSADHARLVKVGTFRHPKRWRHQCRMIFSFHSDCSVARGSATMCSVNACFSNPKSVLVRSLAAPGGRYFGGEREQHIAHEIRRIALVDDVESLFAIPAVTQVTTRGRMPFRLGHCRSGCGQNVFSTWQCIVQKLLSRSVDVSKPSHKPSTIHG